jgi:Holliday junction DNA helicase RuvA
MLAFIKGKVHSIEEEILVLDLNGLGFSVLTPFAMLQPSPVVGEEVFLHTHLQIRDDAWQIFGFPRQDQLQIFRYLLGISGIGAKTALAVLNTLSIPQIVAAANHNDTQLFCTVPGIGKKTAQRLILELKDKVGSWGGDEVEITAMPASGDGDLLAALSQLGFGAAESRALALQAIEKLGQEAETGHLLKEALRLAARS